jgi:hypothetical protein
MTQPNQVSRIALGIGLDTERSHQLRDREAAADPVSDRIISLAQAGHITGLSVDTLRRCSRRKELRILKLSPRRCGIRLSELWAFIERRAA